MEKMNLHGLQVDLFYLGLILNLLITIVFVLSGLRTANGAQAGGRFRYNLLRIRFFDYLFKRRWLQFAMQILPVILLVLIIATGLFGVQSSSKNLAPVLTWTIWWVLIIFDIVLFGRMWCLVCPWYALSTWVKRLSFYKRRKEWFSLNLKWPKALRNIYFAVGLFILFTWLELGFNMTASPMATAVLGIIMTVLVFGSSLVFEKMSFCRYACMVGRICGLYSKFAPVEVRAAKVGECSTCRTRECYSGNEKGYACPTSQCLGNMDDNTYCNACSECFKSCTKNNVAFNVRSFGADLLKPVRPKKDEAAMALVMLSLVSFHGLTMTQSWTAITDALQRVFSSEYLLSFTTGMSLVLVVPAIIFLSFSQVEKRVVGDSHSSEKDLHHPFIHYAYALIPIALFFHLSHNAHHFISEGAAIMSVLSDPFGWGWDIFGTASWQTAPLLSPLYISWIQVILIVIGHFYAVRVCLAISRQRYEGKRSVALSAALISIILFFLSFCNLWLLAQPMIMRTKL